MKKFLIFLVLWCAGAQAAVINVGYLKAGDTKVLNAKVGDTYHGPEDPRGRDCWGTGVDCYWEILDKNLLNSVWLKNDHFQKKGTVVLKYEKIMNTLRGVIRKGQFTTVQINVTDK